MTLLKDNNYKDINVALLSLEADIKNKITGSFDTSEIDKQLAEINSRIDKINTNGGSSSSDEIEDINSKLNSNSIKIRNIEQNVEDIGTQIDGIEQKLSEIFSAESKVTDFNTTTASGIYYWVIDAANRPTDYGVLLVNKYDGGDSASNLWINQVAYGTNNKIYFRQNINSDGWAEWKAVVFEGGINAVPSYKNTDAGKALIVNSGGTGTEWNRLIKYHDIVCGNVTIPSKGWVELNSSLNDNEVPISAVVYRWTTNTGAFYVTAYGGNPKLFYIVGTPGVVISELTVRIYCVDKVVLS